MIKKEIVAYFCVFIKRVYRPIRPWTTPILRQMSVLRLLVICLLLIIGGNLSKGWKIEPKESAAWWPWSSKSHSKMSTAWYKAGDESKSLLELKKADSWQLLYFKNRQVYEKSKKIVNEPERVRLMIAEWEKLLDKDEGYKDGWLSLAELEFRRYNSESTSRAFSKGEYLDPVGKNTLLIKDLLSN